MKNSMCKWFLATAILIGGVGYALAEDIDIFTSAASSGASPQVLIILDNASAWDADTSFKCTDSNVVSTNNAGKDVGFEQCALYEAIKAIGNSDALRGKIDMGLMMFGGSTNWGGIMKYPSAAPYNLPTMDSSGAAAFEDYIKSIDRQADNSNSSQVGGGMYEAYSFFTGRRSDASGVSYSSHTNNACQRNFIIYIANALNNGKPQDTGSNAFNELRAAGASSAQLAQINTSYIGTYTKYDANWGDEWARFLYQGDLGTDLEGQQNIITYSIAVTDGKNPDYVQLTQSMANAGGGKNFVVTAGDVNGLVEALLKILYEVQAVNSVFAASSLPVASNAQGSFENQIFIGMFRPDGKGNPRWMGNLKQYKFGITGSPPKLQLYLADSNGAPAINAAGTGFISPTAVSYWTSKDPSKLPDSIGSTGGFWINNPQGAGGGFDSPDGEVVEKGAVGQQIRLANLQDDYVTNPATPRKLYTCWGSLGLCPSGASLSATPFATTNAGLTASAFGITGSSPTDLIRWARGDDNVGDELSPGNGITVRPSVHGDVVHSRPTIINYGGSIGVVVFYGSNDGVFRAVNGNQTGSIGGVPPGGELWGFIPQEFFSKLQRLYSNSPLLKLANTPGGLTPTPTPKDYFFDGVTGVYQDAASGKAYIYLSARRGGRLIYALDVSDPADPRFMWKKGCPSLGTNTGCDGGFDELGQTWSVPKVAKVKGYSNPVLIFGAGYAGGYDSTYSPLYEDAEPPAADTMGRGIFVLDALTGEMVWQATRGGGSNTCQGNPCRLLDMTYSIAADVTLLDRMNPDGTPPDGYVDRLYAADTGGNIWRVDLEPGGNTAPSAWQVTRLAALGGTGATKRKFLFPPDVVTTKNYDAVLAGTGDREHPLYANSSYNVVNRFYMIKDTNTGNDGSGGTTVYDSTSSTADDAPSSLFQVIVQYNADGTATTLTPYPTSSPLSGFYITLNNTGEKIVNGPTTIGGFTYFGTNQPVAPSNLSCKGLGNARAYQVNFVTGATASTALDGGGLPPSPVAGLVNVDYNGNTLVVPFLLGGNPSPDCNGPDCRSSLGGSRPTIPINPTRRRLYWYLDKLDK
ncbi:MAG TPA: pilus assembly protein PilY [Casimicrobiaceae bacterium]